MPIAQEVKERRRYIRVAPSLSNPVKTTIQDEDLHLEALRVKDISLGGIAVELPDNVWNVPVGRQVSKLEIELPKLGKVVASGVIRRLDVDRETNKKICALEFTRVPIPADRLLYQYINRRQRELYWFANERVH